MKKKKPHYVKKKKLFFKNYKSKGNEQTGRKKDIGNDN
jgi:hypothetical protein